MNLTIKNTTTTLQETADRVIGTTRDVYYAGLGIFAMLEEEVRDAYDALVREGKQVEKGRPNTLTAKAVVEAEDEVREAKRDVKEAGRKVEAFGKDFETRVVETVGNVLNRMNVPTRDDIDALKKSVDRLNKKAVQLRAA